MGEQVCYGRMDRWNSLFNVVISMIMNPWIHSSSILGTNISGPGQVLSSLYPGTSVCAHELQIKPKLLDVTYEFQYILGSENFTALPPTHLHSSTHTVLDPSLNMWLLAELGSSASTALDMTSVYLTFSLEVGKLQLIQASVYNLALIWSHLACEISCLAFIGTLYDIQ